MPLFKNPDADWREAIYYHYYEAGGHGVPAHYGIRDERYKLVHFPRTDEWNLVDLKGSLGNAKRARQARLQEDPR